MERLHRLLLLPTLDRRNSLRADPLLTIRLCSSNAPPLWWWQKITTSHRPTKWFPTRPVGGVYSYFPARVYRFENFFCFLLVGLEPKVAYYQVMVSSLLSSTPTSEEMLFGAKKFYEESKIAPRKLVQETKRKKKFLVAVGWLSAPQSCRRRHIKKQRARTHLLLYCCHVWYRSL